MDDVILLKDLGLYCSLEYLGSCIGVILQVSKLKTYLDFQATAYGSSIITKSI